MRVKLEFHLPEDKDDFDLAMDGWKYKLVLSHFRLWLDDWKHRDKDLLRVEDVRDRLHEIAEEWGVEI